MQKYSEMKTKKDVLEFLNAYIDYRGGMGNRIDALTIRDFLMGLRNKDFKKIMARKLS